MATKRDYYETLGVDKNADETAIRKAYREIAKKYHPDVRPDDKEAEAIFKEATEAYSVLSDKEKRQKYDQIGHEAFTNTGGAGGGSYDFNYNDLSSMFGGFGDIFSEMFGGRTSRSANPNAPRKGATIQASINISFSDAVFGCDKEIEIPYKETCSSCNGTGMKKGTSTVKCAKCGGRGQINVTQQTIFGMAQTIKTCPDCNGKGEIIKEKCPDCNGKGYKSIRKKINITIPAGVDDGNSLKLAGRGDPGINGGERGDLIIQIFVKEDPLFERDEYDIYTTVKIPYTKAALGGEINIKTIHGDEKYTIKAGTQTDTVVQLRGKGVPKLHGFGRGDHFAKLVVDVPKKLNSKQKELLESLAKTFEV